MKHTRKQVIEIATNGGHTVAKAIADAVVLDPHAMAAVKEWQQSRSEAMMHGATTKEGDRFKAACDAIAAIKVPS